MNQTEKQIITKYANKQITLDFIKVLDQLEEILHRGSIDYVKCSYCAKTIKDFMEAIRLINKTKDELENEPSADLQEIKQ